MSRRTEQHPRRRPHRGRIATLAALALAAPLVFVGTASVPTIGAAFTDIDLSEAYAVGTAHLPAPTGVQATRDARGVATLTWNRPAGLDDRTVSYTVERTVGARTTTLAPLVGPTALADDLTVSGVHTPHIIRGLGVGAHHTCALADGNVSCWGLNDLGQLGVSTTLRSSAQPVPVDRSGVLAGKQVTALDAGARHTCAIADGAVYCWGSNMHGALGSGLNSQWSSTPVAVDTSGVLHGKTVTHLSVGAHFTCVIADGLPYCWGRQYRGSLGHGDPTDFDQPRPVAVRITEELQGKVAVEIVTGTSHACIRTADYVAFCWGDNRLGQLGIASSGDASAEPRLVRGSEHAARGHLRSVMMIGAGDDSTCAYARKPSDSSMKFHCWGSYLTGEPRDGLPPQGYSWHEVPTAVDTGFGGGIALVHAGRVTCAAPTSWAVAACWGEGHNGEIGDGYAEDRLTPVFPDFQRAGAVIAIGHGVSHGCAIKGSRVECWGTSRYGAHGSDELQLLTPRALPTDGELGKTRCDTGWTLVDGDRCAPGEAVPVSYRVGYTVEGWSPHSTPSVPALWRSTQ